METTNKKRIGNVNILDLRQATDESVAEIERIANVNVVIQTQATAQYVQQLSIGNVNAIITIPEGVDVRQMMGLAELSARSLEGTAAPVYMIVMGKLLIHPDVTPESISKAIAGISMFGKLVCPEPVMGAIQGKLDKVAGKTLTYPVLDRNELRSLILDENYLHSLDDGTKLTIAGSLEVPEVIPSELIARKLAVLHVASGGTCHEENQAALQRVMTQGSIPLDVIPAGYRLVDRPLTLDRVLLSALRDPFLYATERIVISDDVPGPLLDENIKGLHSEQLIACPNNLESVMRDKVDLLGERVIFYEGELILIDGTTTLYKSRLVGRDRPVTLLVFGVLEIDGELTTAELRSGVARIENFGVIECSRDQMSAVESLLATREGELNETGKKVPAEDWIGNVNLLEL